MMREDEEELSAQSIVSSSSTILSALCVAVIIWSMYRCKLFSCTHAISWTFLLYAMFVESLSFLFQEQNKCRGINV